MGHAFLETGQIRRYAAVLAHRNAGFVQNGMGVWKVPEERLDECGAAMAAFRGVSHCYQRPTYPDWEYNLFSMTHGRTKADCEAVLAAISAETGLTDYSVLYSTKEYKKTRVSYFTPEEAAWEQVHAPLAV
jgi:DNA-binding Lrp family transcriptional regulator